MLSHKGSGEGGAVHTWWVQKFFDIFGKKGGIWRMILENNLTGYCFVLRDFVLIELFQISENWQRVVDLLTVIIFFQSNYFTAFKVKDEKEETTFYLLMVLSPLKIIHPFESKKHFRT